MFAYHIRLPREANALDTQRIFIDAMMPPDAADDRIVPIYSGTYSVFRRWVREHAGEYPDPRMG